MAKYVYTEGVLHSNGETVNITGSSDADKLYTAFPKASQFVSSDGKTQFLLSGDGSSFVVLTIDPAKQGLGEKPQCNNYNDCVADCPETEKPETGGE